MEKALANRPLALEILERIVRGASKRYPGLFLLPELLVLG